MRSEEELSVTETVQDDLYVAGGRVDVSADILWDLITAGWEIILNGAIQQDAILAGGDIEINQPVGDDVRVAGWAVTIRADVGWDLVVFAGDLRVEKWVTIGWDLIVFAETITMNGEVLGETRIGWEKLYLNGSLLWNADLKVQKFSSETGSGAIEWNLIYKSKNKNLELEQLVNGEIRYTESDWDELKEWIFGLVMTYLMYTIVSTFVFACLLFFLLEKVWSEIAKKVTHKTGKSALYGFLIFVGTPFVILLLAITFIGIPFAIFTLFLYIALFVFANLINVLVFTSVITKKYALDTVWKKVLVLLGLTIVFSVINGVGIIAALFSFGAIAMYKSEIVAELRK